MLERSSFHTVYCLRRVLTFREKKKERERGVHYSILTMTDALKKKTEEMSKFLFSIKEKMLGEMGDSVFC